MLWFKAFHIISMVTWFAGLFYLPRLFVYHVGTTDTAGHERFLVMERKLFIIMTIGALLTAVFGLALLHWHGWMDAYFASQGWWHAKLTCVLLLIGFHVWCWFLYRGFRDGNNKHSERWFRLFNEVPALALVAIVILVVVRPF